MNLNLDDPEMQKPASPLPSVMWDIIVALNIRTSSVEYVRLVIIIVRRCKLLKPRFRGESPFPITNSLAPCRVHRLELLAFRNYEKDIYFL
jgi:hypothetical protein